VTSARPLARRDVILISFPFTDLSGQKVRPALIVGRPSGDDVIVAFIGSRVGSAALQPIHQAEHLLEPADPEFASTGLKAPSVIRANKLATLHRRIVRRRLGHIGPRTESGVASCLRHVFGL